MLIDYVAYIFRSRATRIIGCLDGAIYKSYLMLLQHMRENIAGGHRITIQAKLPPGRVGKLRQPLGRERAGEIAPMLRQTVPAGEVPAAKAILKWDRVPGRVVAK